MAVAPRKPGRGAPRSVYLTHEQIATIDALRTKEGWAFNRIAQAALEQYFAQRGIDWPAQYPELNPVTQKTA